MNSPKFMSNMIVLCAMTLVMSCQKGNFASDGSSTCQSTECQTNNGGLNNGGNPTDPNFDDLNGTINSNKAEYNGFLSFKFDKTTGEFIISVPVPGDLFISTQGSIKQLPGARWVTQMGSDGRPRLAIRIPANLILKGVNFLPPGALPSGDALPMMPSGQGELPSLALELPTKSDKTQLYLYIGVNAVGVFVTLPPNMALPLQFTFPIRNKDKSRTLGYFTYVPPKLNAAPGLFVSALVPRDIAAALEDYLGL